MKKGSMRLSREIKSIIVIVLILTFIFAFDDGKPSLILKDWFLNFFYVLIKIKMIDDNCKTYQVMPIKEDYDSQQLYVKDMSNYYLCGIK